MIPAGLFTAAHWLTVTPEAQVAYTITLSRVLAQLENAVGLTVICTIDG